MSRLVTSGDAPGAQPGSTPLPHLPVARRTALRVDVQGLRAVAVLTVVAGHYGVPFLRGGYVGVDVFFVISGFLISGLLYREIDTAGRLSLRDFYARRARRILPAATLVILATLVGSLLLISATDALRLVTDSVWATLFVANVRFSIVGTDYNSQTLATSPLQHYWSLAVEEQFYVVWPLLVLLCVLLARRAGHGRSAEPHGAPRLPRRGLAVVLVAVTVASLTYAVLRSHADPTATYFSAPARAWELAVGALAALVARGVSRRLAPPARGLLGGGGVVAIVVACVLLGPTTQSHAAAYLLPVLGTVAVLVAGAGGHAREPWPLRALGVAPLRAVGDWSFSLYLWHWPLLIVATDVRGSLSPGVRALLAALALALAALTYRFVETPLRSPVRLPRPRALMLYPASVALVCLTCVAGSFYGHYRAGEFGNDPAVTVADFRVGNPSEHLSTDPTTALVQASVVAALHHQAVPSHLEPPVTDLLTDVPDLGACEYGRTGNRNLCPRGDTGADRVIAVLGNSHGRMWIPAIEEIAQREHYTTYYFTKQNCSAADLSFSDVDVDTPLAPWSDCYDFRHWAFDQIARLHPAITIVSTTGPNPVIFTDGREVTQDSPDREQVTKEGFARTFSELEPLTDRLVLLRDIPKPGFDPGTCLTAPGHDLGDCLFRPVQASEADAHVSASAAREDGLQVIDPTRWLCWKGRCPMVIGDTIAYRDTGHITSVYAESLADDLGRALGVWTEDPPAGS